MSHHHICPRCMGVMPRLPGAMSRTDWTTEICSGCGLDEALNITAQPQESWPVHWLPRTWEMLQAEAFARVDAERLPESSRDELAVRGFIAPWSDE